MYFPREGHVEQTLTVAERLSRQRAGQRRDYRTTTPDALASSIAWLLESAATWPPIPTDGAIRAAELIDARIMPAHAEPRTLGSCNGLRGLNTTTASGHTGWRAGRSGNRAAGLDSCTLT